jgi:hypothetical protein
MATDPVDPSKPEETAKPAEDPDQFLDEADEKFEHLDDEIRQAQRKSKAVIPDPEP